MNKDQQHAMKRIEVAWIDIHEILEYVSEEVPHEANYYFSECLRTVGEIENHLVTVKCLATAELHYIDTEPGEDGE